MLIAINHRVVAGRWGLFCGVAPQSLGRERREGKAGSEARERRARGWGVLSAGGRGYNLVPDCDAIVWGKLCCGGLKMLQASFVPRHKSL